MEDKVYITILGDTWDSISYKLFGDSKAYNLLLELNIEYSDIVMFDAGTRIKYNDNISLKKSENNIPPWRK